MKFHHVLIIAALITVGLAYATAPEDEKVPPAPVVVVEQTPTIPPGTEPVGPGLARELRTSGDAPDRKTRDWQACWQVIGDTTWIVCPDGYTESS